MNGARSYIVKVQAPVIDPAGDLLIYAEGRRMVSAQPSTPAIRAALRGDMKGYFRAQRHGKTGWAVGDRIEDQDW